MATEAGLSVRSRKPPWAGKLPLGNNRGNFMPAVLLQKDGGLVFPAELSS